MSMSAPTTTTTSSSPSTAPVKTEGASPSGTPPAKTEVGNTNANAGTPPKRKSARRANTAERRATHNAVERMRRETLNGRFLTLASLLPPLAALRRPSKAAIVSSSIATVHAARRHRVLAAQTLRALGREAEQLRREVNEWRLRARVPPLAAPPRSDAHAAVLRAEVEDFDLTLEEGLDLEEDGEDGDEGDEGEEPTRSPNHSSSSPPQSATVSTPPQSSHMQQLQNHHQAQHDCFAFEAPSPTSPASPSSASSRSSEGPGTPPASAGAHIPMPMPMHAQQQLSLLAQQQQMALMQQMHPYDQMQMQMKELRARAASISSSLPLASSIPAMGSPSIKIPMMHHKGYDAPVHGGGANYELDLGLGGLGFASPSSAPDDFVLMGMGMGGGWAGANPQHPAFHAQQQQMQQEMMQYHAQQHQRAAYEQQQQQQMMAMQGMGQMKGVQFGQYLHQPGAFA